LAKDCGQWKFYYDYSQAIFLAVDKDAEILTVLKDEAQTN
jgi:hypothetical protein